MDHFSEIQQILASVGGDAGDISLDTSLVSDLGMDSFMLMDAVTKVEDAFNLEIPDQDLRKFITVGDVIDYLKARGQ